ncbi:PhzF family phenazine biosynthesis protein [Fulvivirgaceae bacterium BMA12]|uniref:PhzF family phenazine biosynthesis protein n=1 Tax=Agaribacillus aureus TaxID=3051825 RepID=A0ABT8L071_9BACT|nr:PhzF family phenazine biosynthesis protein [Fulvivirgaceae bacterium BMA12]
MKLKLYQIDAFTDRVFGGNPAGVCILDDWLSEDIMQKIALENNLAETAFVVEEEGVFGIRWFTPLVEIDLCGHATLAAAYVLFEHFQYDRDTIEFYSTRSGTLKVSRTDELLTMDFPTDDYAPVTPPENIVHALGSVPLEAFRGKTDYLLTFSSQQEVENLSPDFNLLSKVDGRGVIVSSPGDQVDFVSRFFAPQVGISEDPVTGSAHTTLTPVWSKKLGKNQLTAKQISQRGGDLWCEFLGDRVKISGKAVTYLVGEIAIT